MPNGIAKKRRNVYYYLLYNECDKKLVEDFKKK